MRKILIPTDFSENADNALRYAFKMCEGEGDVEFTLLNAYDTPRGGSNTMLVSITDILKKDSEIGLDKCKKEFQKAGNKFPVLLSSKHGSLSEVISELLKKEDFDLIVMGTQGAGGLKKVLLGSNTSDVVKGIKKPILIVPKRAVFVQPKKILFTTDFKPVKRDIQINELKNFALIHNAEILILNITNGGQTIDMESSKVSSGLEDLFKEIKHSYHQRINTDTITGIDNFIKEHDVQIVAMILRQIGFIDNLFHKSLTREMAMHTNIPMLALHD